MVGSKRCCCSARVRRGISLSTALERMAGHEDGITDALFRFARPISGGCYWCPPMKDGKLDLELIA